MVEEYEKEGERGVRQGGHRQGRGLYPPSTTAVAQGEQAPYP